MCCCFFASSGQTLNVYNPIPQTIGTGYAIGSFHFGGPFLRYSIFWGWVSEMMLDLGKASKCNLPFLDRGK